MKIFETPEMKISKFNRGNIITLSGEEPVAAKDALTKAQEIASAKYADTSIFNFVVGS